MSAAPPITRQPFLTAVESIHTLPTNRALFVQATIMNVLEGEAEVITQHESHRLLPGTALALGGDRWRRILPSPHVRLWTAYIDEQFLRSQMAWFLPDKSRIHIGIHPQEWDGRPVVLRPGLSALRKVEPLWRQMSLLHVGTHQPEMAATRAVELLARWTEVVMPTFLSQGAAAHIDKATFNPVNGRLTASGTVGHIGRAAQLLRERMDKSWTATELARTVAVSRTHLTRLFITHIGIAPMRYLTEVRLTEFTRLIEETDYSVTRAANAVGWSDPRVASAWFYRRYGVMPTQYRLSPHPHQPDREVCANCNQHRGTRPP